MLKKLLIKWYGNEFYLAYELACMEGIENQASQCFDSDEIINKYYNKYKFKILLWWIIKGFKYNNMYWYKN